MDASGSQKYGPKPEHGPQDDEPRSSRSWANQVNVLRKKKTAPL